MKIALLFLIIFMCIGCHSQNKKINFVNNSKLLIDSVSINVFSANTYQIKLLNMKSKDSVINKIPIKSPTSNNHDITVAITVYINGKLPIYEYSYNDLEGTLSYNYLIIYNENNKLEWKTFKE